MRLREAGLVPDESAPETTTNIIPNVGQSLAFHLPCGALRSHWRCDRVCPKAINKSNKSYERATHTHRTEQLCS